MYYRKLAETGSSISPCHCCNMQQYSNTHTHTHLKYGYAVTMETGMMKKGLVPLEKAENRWQCRWSQGMEVFHRPSA